MYLAGSNFLKRQQQYKAIQDNSLALKIKLSQQANQEMLPFWKQIQQGLYPNTYNITPTQTIDQSLISNDTIADKLNNPTDEANVPLPSESNLIIFITAFDFPIPVPAITPILNGTFI